MIQMKSDIHEIGRCLMIWSLFLKSPNPLSWEEIVQIAEQQEMITPDEAQQLIMSDIKEKIKFVDVKAAQ